MDKKIENTIPVLPVKSMEESIQYYVDTLGFSVDWKGSVVGSVSRDDWSIMLSETTRGSDPGGGSVWRMQRYSTNTKRKVLR